MRLPVAQNPNTPSGAGDNYKFKFVMDVPFSQTSFERSSWPWSPAAFPSFRVPAEDSLGHKQAASGFARGLAGAEQGVWYLELKLCTKAHKMLPCAPQMCERTLMEEQGSGGNRQGGVSMCKSAWI